LISSAKNFGSYTGPALAAIEVLDMMLAQAMRWVDEGVIWIDKPYWRCSMH
jgi:hypothetical protein